LALAICDMRLWQSASAPAEGIDCLESGSLDPSVRGDRPQASAKRPAKVKACPPAITYGDRC
jgi:hypothetical protein